MSHVPLAKQARLLRTLSHPGRLAIVATLGRSEACVCHLSAALDRSQPHVSQQLAILRAAGLISSRRRGTFTYYSLRDFSVLGLVELADRLAGNAVAPHARAGALAECGCPACRPVVEERHAR